MEAQLRLPRQQSQRQVKEAASTVQDHCEALRHVSEAALKLRDGQSSEAVATAAQCEKLEAEVNALAKVIDDASVLCASLEATKEREKAHRENCEAQLTQVRAGLDSVASRHEQFTAALNSVEAVAKQVRVTMDTLTQPSSRLVELVEEGKAVLGGRTARDFRAVAAELRRRHTCLRDRLSSLSCEADTIVQLAESMKEWPTSAWQQYGELATVMESVRELYETAVAARAAEEGPEGHHQGTFPAASDNTAHLTVERLLFTKSDGEPEEAQLFGAAPSTGDEGTNEVSALPCVTAAEQLTQHGVRELQRIDETCRRVKVQCDEGNVGCDLAVIHTALEDMTARWREFLATYQSWADHDKANNELRGRLTAEEDALAAIEVSRQKGRLAVEEAQTVAVQEASLNEEVEAEIANYHKAISCAVSAAEAQQAAVTELSTRLLSTQKADEETEKELAQLHAKAAQDAAAHVAALSAHELALAAVVVEQQAAKRGEAVAQHRVSQVESAASQLRAQLTHFVQSVVAPPVELEASRPGSDCAKEGWTTTYTALAPDVAAVRQTLEDVRAAVVERGGGSGSGLCGMTEETIAAALQRLPGTPYTADREALSTAPFDLSPDALQAMVSACVSEAPTPKEGQAAHAEDSTSDSHSVDQLADVLCEKCPSLRQAPRRLLEHCASTLLSGYQQVAEAQRSLDALTLDSEAEVSLLERELASS